jgi:hypothetical protein
LVRFINADLSFSLISIIEGSNDGYPSFMYPGDLQATFVISEDEPNVSMDYVTLTTPGWSTPGGLILDGDLVIRRLLAF